MTEKFVITGMTCAACAAHVERAAASVPGVHSASVNRSEERRVGKELSM